MKKSKYTESQVVFALQQAETGTPVAEVCRKMGISDATFYNWKKRSFLAIFRGNYITHLNSCRYFSRSYRTAFNPG